jgi:integrase/recombinase XerD
MPAELIQFKRGLQTIEMPGPSDDKLVDDFLRSKVSPETERKRNMQISAFRTWYSGPLADVNATLVREWVADELDGLAQNSRRAYVAALRTLFVWLRDERGTVAPWANLGGVKIGNGPDDLAVRILSPPQVRAILAKIEEQSGRHWFVFFRLQYEVAARCGELTALRWDWIAPVAGGGATVTLFGKFDKTRWEHIGPEMTAMIAELPRTGERVFNADNRTARGQFKRAARAAGIPAASTHWLRHSRLSHLAALGVPIVALRDFAGHTNIATTSRYLHVVGRSEIMPSTLPGDEGE